MSSIPSSSYAEWRLRGLAATALREQDDSSIPSERLLQIIWQHQRLRREPLPTNDGRAVRILHPGFWNHEAGPDFRGAVVQFDSAVPVSGDIEIDLHPHGWRTHGHDTNPHYQHVILHVVWEGDLPSAAPLPTVCLSDALDAPLNELRLWLGNDVASEVAGVLLGQCCAPLNELPMEVCREIVHQAAQVRLQAKAAHLQTRARQAGWEQALWEGMFSALGYKHNVWPMRRLAEMIPLLRRESSTTPAQSEWEARLLGLSGLLPADVSRARKSSSDYVRGLWDAWWREREVLSPFVLPCDLWRMSGLRPANHPQRRLALAAHWLSRSDFIEKLERWFAASISDSELLPTLLVVLQSPPDDFWSRHWTFDSKLAPVAQPLLGPPRVTDLAMNILLPWFWTRAVAGKSELLQRTAEHRYFAWPKAQDNATLRLARQRLFGRANVREIKTAAAQQGLLQVLRDFCEHSNALCENCRFPEMLRTLK